MSGSSWTQKAIDITIRLGKGTFGQTGQNTVKLSGLRTIVSVEKAGFPSMDKVQARVYGVPPSIMNEVSTLGVPLTMWRLGNAVLVEAGDVGGSMFTVYNGYLHQAYQDFSEAPETALALVGWGGQAAAIQPTDATSYSGSTSVATIMEMIAKGQGWTFENNNVTVQVSNPYLWGTALQQVHDLARMAGIEVYVDTGHNPVTLAIWSRTFTRGGQVPLINGASGMIGYPRFQSSGMSFRSLFNPNIKLGGQIKMESTVGGAGTIQVAGISGDTPSSAQGGPNGAWCVIGLTLDLSSQLPGGPWFCDVQCARTNVLAPSS